jgi:predicted protein tyrosine phosphatase
MLNYLNCKKFHHRLILPVNLLFVCSQNKWRSPTGETLYRHDPRVNVRSAGTSANAKKSISEQDLIWADLVMENKHKKIITSQILRLEIQHRYNRRFANNVLLNYSCNFIGMNLGIPGLLWFDDNH